MSFKFGLTVPFKKDLHQMKRWKFFFLLIHILHLWWQRTQEAHKQGDLKRTINMFCRYNLLHLILTPICWLTLLCHCNIAVSFNSSVKETIFCIIILATRLMAVMAGLCLLLEYWPPKKKFKLELFLTIVFTFVFLGILDRNYETESFYWHFQLTNKP